MLIFVTAFRVVWEFIIPFWVVCLTVTIGVSIYRRKRYKRIFERFLHGEYEKVIPIAKKHKQQQLDLSIVRNQNVIYSIDSLSYVIAVSSLAINDTDTFLQHINEIQSSNMQIEKYYWLTIFYLTQNEITSAQENYNHFLSCDETPTKKMRDEFLLALFDYKKGNIADAQVKILQIKDQFSNPVAKKFMDDMLNGNL